MARNQPRAGYEKKANRILMALNQIPLRSYVEKAQCKQK